MPEPDRRSHDPPLILPIIFLLTVFSGGESEATGLYVQAAVGGNISLPCHIKPAMDATDRMVEWSRPDLDPRLVHVRRFRKDHLLDQNPFYKERTSVPVSGLKQGDASLSLSKVRLSDQGTYRCLIPGLNTQMTVQLAVAAVIKITKASTGELECESRGWYPEPEVLWLDSEGNPLSAGPPETVRGPDDLYTVSSRVTVDKRHSNTFTCRVQQNNHHREAQIIVPDDFFQESSRSTTSTVIGLIIGLVFILVVGFLGWKWRQTNKKNDSEPHQNIISQSTDPEKQSLMNKGDEVKAERITTQNEVEEQRECSGPETELLCQKVKETTLKTDSIPTNRGEHTEERSAGAESLSVMKSGQIQGQRGGETVVDMDNKEKRDTEMPGPSDKGTCREQPDQNEDKGNEGRAPPRTMDGKQEDTEREPETHGQERQKDAHEEPRKPGQSLMDGQQQQDVKGEEAKNDKDEEENKEEGLMTNQENKGSTEEKTHDPTGGEALEDVDSTRVEIKSKTDESPGPQKDEGENELNSPHNDPASPEDTKEEQTEEEETPKDEVEAKNDKKTVGLTEEEIKNKSEKTQHSAREEHQTQLNNDEGGRKDERTIHRKTDSGQSASDGGQPGNEEREATNGLHNNNKEKNVTELTNGQTSTCRGNS